MALQKQMLTASDFQDYIALSENRDRLFQLIDKLIGRRIPIQDHSVLAASVATHLNVYLWKHPIGRVAVQTQHHSANDEHDHLPDVFFVRDLPKSAAVKGVVPFMADLAIEIKSPDDRFKDIRSKARCHLSKGTRLVWLVFPKQRIIEVYTQNDEYVLGEDETLTGENVLPGFSLPVRELLKDV
jgi:Uma2 family endonuclease